ncbi:hypothetical protein COO91_06639 [Nostoc flagelliforme CCNUN1]|uniref:Uncharacterized protein n=1 Tax=Nostoc flagelliforme CCNUN1 TaxID=2038116 RepID=A0A2K8SZ13_9NOSO|nr:hypothetical protein COO91_06639 [Nostoc flagelliforme CCNUN1]
MNCGVLKLNLDKLRKIAIKPEKSIFLAENMLNIDPKLLITNAEI